MEFVCVMLNRSWRSLVFSGFCVYVGLVSLLDLYLAGFAAWLVCIFVGFAAWLVFIFSWPPFAL